MSLRLGSAARSIAIFRASSAVRGCANPRVFSWEAAVRAGVNVRIVLPVGTSPGTSIVRRRLSGMSTVCVTLMG